MNNFSDVALIDKGDYYDIDFDENGDFKLTDTLDTAFLISLFGQVRADETEVPASYLRGGWWGDLYTPINYGSKLWLLNQSVNTPETLAKAINYCQLAFQWLVDLKYADQIQVSGTQTTDGISLTIAIFKNGSKVTEKVYNLWENTIINAQ